MRNRRATVNRIRSDKSVYILSSAQISAITSYQRQRVQPRPQGFSVEHGGGPVVQCHFERQIRNFAKLGDYLKDLFSRLP